MESQPHSFAIIFRTRLLPLIILPVIFSCNQPAPPEAQDFANASAFEWRYALPEQEGFSTQKLYAMRDTLAGYGTKALLVIRHDNIVLEWYARGWHPKRKHYTASLAKALVGGSALMLAMQDGRLAPDDPAWKYIPEWAQDSLKSMITIRQLATHTSGIEDAEITEPELAELRAKGLELRDRHMDIPGWKGSFWRQDANPFVMSRDHAPVRWTPGTEYHYSNPGMGMLSYAITSSYAGSPYTDIRMLLKERIMQPIGIEDDAWSIGYGKTFPTNGLNLVACWGGGGLTPRATARVGRLMLRKGNWEGAQLVDTTVVEEIVGYAGMPLPPRNAKQPAPASALAWYCNYDGIWPQVPRDAFAGAGAGNQVLIVIPSLDMIIVRNGASMQDESKGEGFWYGIEQYLLNGLMEAFMQPPYPQSDYIQSIEFAPAVEIIRKASGSDNWPLTWADDGNMYTAYGDGWGFEPRIEKKLSLGLARIEGYPPDFNGIKIRSETGEFTGQGRKGKKASGMLMVDDTLYMWIRNANENGEQSQLGWSADHGETWTFANWKFAESFGYPTFLNYGMNYEGAADNYVYIYSHDDNSAYKPADRMVLARVEKSKLRERQAYRFYAGSDGQGQPIWTDRIEGRSAVFTHPGMCYRSGITYNPGIKRYLWCQNLLPSKHPDGARFQGGFGIYEAPSPWGPWRTVFYTKDWDVGPGETASIPVKWLSEDGRVGYLVFSGNDCFSVRKFALRINKKE